jgi:transcription antitermination protein NusB
MGARREGRESAMQFLFLRDLGGAGDDGALEAFFRIRDSSPSARKFCRALVQGVLEKLTEIDAELARLCDNYEIHRISAVDRNILRVALFEMLHCADVPPVVSINEAIEIAKKYSTEESGRFVNGILDRCRSGLQRPARTRQDLPPSA